VILIVLQPHTAAVNDPVMTAEMCALLKVLTNGIVPADERDGGAESVGAAGQIAQRVEQGVNRDVYLSGLGIAKRIAEERFKVAVDVLTPEQAHELVGAVRDDAPGFYKQLRMDVSAIYLSNPAVWARIGFPGPSIEKGGYPDFDQPQGGGR
jgi:hypothetical protein